MSFQENEEKFEELKLTSYSSAEGLDYMTIEHLASGICLGSKPIVRDDINRFDKKIQQRIIREDTRNRLIQEMTKFAKDLLI